MWEKAWREVKKSPFIGSGPQSDRYKLREHVHNTYMYALLQSGFLGASFFVGGLAWAWLLVFKISRHGKAEFLDQKIYFIQSAGILSFFTVRSIPEVCGAMFSIDYLVMLPILAYLNNLNIEAEKNNTANPKLQR